MHQQQQQQQQQQDSTSFTNVCSQASLVWHIATHLVLRDAAAFAQSTSHAAGALRGCLHGNSQLALCPRIIIAASGSGKLLELPLTHEGRVHQCSRAAGAAGAAAAAAGTTAVAATPAAAVIREVAAKKRKRRPARLTMAKSTNATWLTGVAVGPHADPTAATTAAADHGHTQALYVCDYNTRGVLKFCTSSLRPLGVFASGPALKHPEAITWVGSTCYVSSAGNGSIVALDSQGRVQQVLDISEASMPSVIWGMTVWLPQHCPIAAAASGEASAVSDPAAAASPLADALLGAAAVAAATAATAALFLAADMEYLTARYTVPPKDATGGVLRVALSSSGAMQGPPQLFSRVAIKRPSGLTFDHQGHLWVTSLDGLLLRLAGPASPAPGSLLQTLHLQQLLPSPANTFLPFDVLAMPLPTIAAAAARGLARRTCTAERPWTAGAVVGCDGTDMVQQVVHCTGTQLVVTLHKGPREGGAVAVLRFGDACAVQGTRQQSTGVLHNESPAAAAAGAQHTNSGEQRQTCVTLVELVMRHKALREPNMLTVV